MKKKYLFYTDIHMDKMTPWTKINFIRNIIKEKPHGLFITGDISNGLMLSFDLSLLAKFIKCPIYFVLGNHDRHFSSFEEVALKVRKLCQKYQNLIWLSDHDPIILNKKTVIIGSDGWYNGMGDPKYLKFTLDWILIKEFKSLPTMEDRIKLFKKISKQSARALAKKLLHGLDDGYKNIFILTHMPPFKQATRDVGTLMEKFWLPYNVNLPMGKTIKRIMKKYPKNHATVLSGHTHQQANILVRNNINCIVEDASYIGFTKNSRIFYI